MPKTKSITSYFLLATSLALSLPLLIVTIFIVYQAHHSFFNKMVLVKQEYVDQQKALIKTEVLRSISYAQERYLYCKSHDSNDLTCEKVVKELFATIRFRKNNYLFGFSENATSLFSGGEIISSNVNMLDMKDTNGFYMIREMILVAQKEAEGGFVSYTWPKPDVYRKKNVPTQFMEKVVSTGTLSLPDISSSEKVAFVKRIPELKWIVGAGVYLDHIDVVIDAKQKSLRSQIMKQIYQIMVLLFILLGFFFGMIFFFSRRLKRSVDIFISHFSNMDREFAVLDTHGILFSELQSIATITNQVIIWRQETEKVLENYTVLMEEEVFERTHIVQQQAIKLYNQNVLLEQQNKHITQAMQFKTEFFANMSHELRTPLNIILSLTRALLVQEKTLLTGRERKHLETIEKNGHELLEKINEVLDMASLESNKLPAVKKEISLKNILEIIQSNFTNMANKKGLDFRCSIPHTNVPLFTDDKLLYQILQNLVNNAIKFTDKGFIAISAQETTDTVIIRVEDTGIGISENDINSIFNSFWQVDGTLSKRSSGSGLGLSIVKHAAHLIGASIAVHSKVDEGTVFTIIISTDM